MKTSDQLVRKAKRADAAALADLFRDAWQLAYVGIIPHLHVRSMLQSRVPEWWVRAIGNGENTLVMEVAGVVGGYVTFGRSRWPLPYQGEIYELYLAPSYQGVGLGEHLFEGARHALDMRQLSGLLVWALAQNEGAVAFYRRRGGKVVAKSSERYGSAQVPKLGFGWG